MSPRDWRKNTGMSLAQVAELVGIKGKNPSATYRRYELGLSTCPTHIMLTVSRRSDGKVSLQDWASLLAGSVPVDESGSPSSSAQVE